MATFCGGCSTAGSGFRSSAPPWQVWYVSVDARAWRCTPLTPVSRRQFHTLQVAYVALRLNGTLAQMLLVTFGRRLVDCDAVCSRLLHVVPTLVATDGGPAAAYRAMVVEMLGAIDAQGYAHVFPELFGVRAPTAERQSAATRMLHEGGDDGAPAVAATSKRARGDS